MYVHVCIRVYTFTRMYCMYMFMCAILFQMSRRLLKICMNVYTYTHMYVYINAHTCMHTFMYTSLTLSLSMTPHFIDLETLSPPLAIHRPPSHTSTPAPLFLDMVFSFCSCVYMHVCMYVYMYVCVLRLYTLPHSHPCFLIWYFLSVGVCMYVCTYMCEYS